MKQVRSSTVKTSRKGRIQHSACMWCYKGLSVEKMAAAGSRLGLVGIDLLTPDQWAPLKKHGLVCTMTSGRYTIEAGLNHKQNHEPILAELKRNIELTSEAGFKNVIVFSGNRCFKTKAGRIETMSDDRGLETCAAALKQVIPLAEKHRITICMELLNSRVDHPDYMCDRTAWGVELCKAVNSDRFKLLYDIYHMQIMEGDIIQTLRDQIDYIGHVHTGGVPGRHEIDESQELYYPAIMRELVELKYKGYVAQEFVPAKRDQIGSLAAAVALCDV